MTKNLIAKIGGLVLAGSLISSCSIIYSRAYLDDQGLGKVISRELNDKGRKHSNLERGLKENNQETYQFLENDSDKKNLEKRSEKCDNIFSYVKDENSKNYELRMKTDKFSEKEKAEFNSMKGANYNKEKGYISFSSEFEDRKLYDSMKYTAVLSQVYNDKIVSDEEKEFVKKEAPDVYSSLFPFEGKVKEETKKKLDNKLDSPFIEGLVKFYLSFRAKNEEDKMAEEIKKIDVVKGLRDKKDYSENLKDSKKNSEDAPTAPEKN